MANEPDLTLPPTAPSVGRYHDVPMEIRPAALYTLVDISDSDLQDLQQVCESDTEPTEPGINVRLAPQAKYVNEPLRAVFDYHLELGRENTFDPIHFIVAIERDWKAKGVLLVTLDDDDLECKVDSFRIKAEDSGLSRVNLQIGNSSWSEEKESYEMGPREEGDSDDGDDDGDNDSSHGDRDKKTHNDDPDGNDSGPEAPTGPPPLGYYIGVYVLEGLDAEKLINSIEPFASLKKPSEFCCRLQGVLSSTANPIEQAFNLHPMRCVKNSWLQKQLLLIADTNTPTDHGLVLGQFYKDNPASRRIQRVPFSVFGAVQNAFCGIANGSRVWQPSYPAFIVFRYDYGRQELGTAAELLDEEWTQRPEGEECIVFAPAIVQPKRGKPEHIKFSFDEAVCRFPALCRQFRFRENLIKSYFICVDNADVEKEGVLLVKIDWDGNVNKNEGELMELKLLGNATVMRVQVKEAYKTLKDIVEGKKNGPEKNQSRR